jgi:tetratricopeptide (TPR) repeat protein
MSDADWEFRVAAVWADAATLTDDQVLEAIDDLVIERGREDAAALFEAGSVRDYLGRETEAEPFYRKALELGLDEPRHAQALIQLASTLRNLGRPEESVALLRGWIVRHPEHPLADSGRAFLALALLSAGHEREAALVALRTLAPTLPQYASAVAEYAEEL